MTGVLCFGAPFFNQVWQKFPDLLDGEEYVTLYSSRKVVLFLDINDYIKQFEKIQELKEKEQQKQIDTFIPEKKDIEINTTSKKITKKLIYTFQDASESEYLIDNSDFFRKSSNEEKIQQRIQQNIEQKIPDIRAFHPLTRVLTVNGFVPINEIKKNDDVFQYHTNGRITKTKVLKVQEIPYNNKLIVSMLVKSNGSTTTKGYLINKGITSNIIHKENMLILPLASLCTPKSIRLSLTAKSPHMVINDKNVSETEKKHYTIIGGIYNGGDIELSESEIILIIALTYNIYQKNDTYVIIKLDNILQLKRLKYALRKLNIKYAVNSEYIRFKHNNNLFNILDIDWLNTNFYTREMLLKTLQGWIWTTHRPITDLEISTTKKILEIAAITGWDYSCPNIDFIYKNYIKRDFKNKYIDYNGMLYNIKVESGYIITKLSGFVSVFKAL